MKKYILLSMVGLAVVSCRLDDNLNPNKPAPDQFSPELRLAGASTSAYAVQAGSMNGLGNAWTNAWSGNFATFGNPFTLESSLDISTAYRQSMFNNSYQAVARFQRIIEDKNPASYPNYIAIAKIQKAYYMQYVVDLYGDVPYSEAFMEADNSNPKYDNDVAIYQALVQELLDARTLINSSASNPAYAVVSSSDPIFKGNMDKWKEFGNTVMLKFAVRLSNTTNADGIALRNNIIAALAGATYITDNVKINPGYNGSSDDTMNPLYLNFGRVTSAGTLNTQGYRLMTGSDHAIRSLEGDASKITSGVYDSRIDFLFTKAKKYNATAAGGPVGYYGFPQGMTLPQYQVALGYTESSLKGTTANFSFLGGRFYALDGAGDDGYLMMKAESELLQAEAALRGYAGFSGDQAHFQQAISASFIFDGKGSDAAAYISNISTKPQVGWTGTTENKIAAIQYQRWIALMNYNGIESYINYLRTGYPETPLATTAIKPNKPFRMLYPAREYSSNSANVPTVSLDQIFVKNDFTPFIYK